MRSRYFIVLSLLIFSSCSEPPEKEKTVVYLVRHAKSIYDKSIPEQQRGLHPEGTKQAQNLIPDLIPLKITKIYSSTAKRAIDTIKPFAQHANIKIETFKELSEIRLPDLKTLDNFFKTVRQMWGDFDFKIPGYESARECQDRVFNKMLEIAKKNPNQSIAVSFHGQAIALFLNKVDKSWNFERWQVMKFPDIIRQYV